MDEKKVLEQFAKALGVEVKQEVVEAKIEEIKSKKPTIKAFSEMFDRPTYKRTKKLVEKKQLPAQTEITANKTKIVIEHKIKQ